MLRRPTRQVPGTAATVEKQLAPEMRRRLEAARLELLALFRALDSLHIGQHLPDELKALMVLDADFAEALVVLDHPAQGYNLMALERDTLASLASLPTATARFLDVLDAVERQHLSLHLPLVAATLVPQEAYNQIPGRSPHPG